MSCSKNMSRCLASCRHYQDVMEYRLARLAQEQERDRATRGYSTELSDYPAILTFKDWITQLRGRNEDC